MYAVTEDLESGVKDMLASSVPLESIVAIGEAVAYPGELVFWVFDNQQGFYSRYHEWISRLGVLKELHNLPAFIDQLVRMASSRCSGLPPSRFWTTWSAGVSR